MIEKYSASVLQEYYAGLKIEINKWKSDARGYEERIFSYVEKLYNDQGQAA